MVERREFHPWDTEEWKQADLLSAMARDAQLTPVSVICAWSDICGFGALLDSASWSLADSINRGCFRILDSFYRYLAVPLLIGIPPEPSDRLVLLNDGIVRTLDIQETPMGKPIVLILYARDLVIRHWLTLKEMGNYGLGLRTVLAGGERCQYSPGVRTGASHLTHNGTPSEVGRAILEQSFVHSHTFLQMNTGFALAYSLEAAGSAAGIVPNGFYVERSWLSNFEKYKNIEVKVSSEKVVFALNGVDYLTWSVRSWLVVPFRKATREVAIIKGLTIHESLEGEETTFELPIGRNGE